MRHRKRGELIEVIDRSPTAVAAHPGGRFGVNDRGEWCLPRRSGGCSQFVEGGTVGLYTRLWMALTPPEGADPGYACVVGEHYAGELHTLQRPLFLLDECASPLLPELFLQTAALKDLYLADRLFMDPRHERFYADAQRARWGLCAYLPETEWPDPDIRRLHPFFRSRSTIAAPCEPPYVPDDAWGRVCVDTLLAQQDRRGRPLLRVHEGCTFWGDTPHITPHRALALVVMALQSLDWDDRLEEIVQYDGYEQPAETDQREQDEAQAFDAALTALLYQVGDPETRVAVLRADRAVYAPDPANDVHRRLLVPEDAAWLG